jgi:hypothetical protein
MTDPDADSGDTERQVTEHRNSERVRARDTETRAGVDPDSGDARRDTESRVEGDADSDRKQAVVPLDSGTERSPVRPTRPLEPEAVDIENAMFVLLGVVLVGGLLVGAIAGL